MKTPEQRQNDMIEAAKKYAKQYEGLMYTIGSIAGIAGIQKAFERGVQFGLHQALDITVEREKAERDAEQQWISVKEQLPRPGQEVLIVDDQIMRVQAVSSYGKWHPYVNGSSCKPTHWMPLSEPPKAEK